MFLNFKFLFATDLDKFVSDVKHTTIWSVWINLKKDPFARQHFQGIQKVYMPDVLNSRNVFKVFFFLWVTKRL